LSAPLLEVRGLSKFFELGGFGSKRRLRALNDVSLSLECGEIVALVGESGSGKSTVARLVARLIQPTAGQILLEGKDVLADEPRRASLSYRAKVQMIFQDPFGSLNPVYRIDHHLERPLILHGKAKSKADLASKVHALLASVGLEPAGEFARKHPHEASGGQRQRVAIARALAVDPQVILADEPVSMLDVSIRTGVLNLMERLKTERGLAFLYITHDIASARYVADRTLVMYAGHVVEGAPSEELLQKPAHPYTELLLSAVPDPRRFATASADAAASESVERAAAPELIDPPPGCPFAARCPRVLAVCRETMPAPTELGGGHWVRCHAVKSA
jgi:peptide/nickel transport system ATP-binding protein